MLKNYQGIIEFTSDNFGAYSIEMARILLAASSEVDVVVKHLCIQVALESKDSNIDQYRNTLRKIILELENSLVTLPRYGFELTPWSNWREDNTPNWWRSHNNVKHQQDQYFSEANLKNILNSVAGLFLMVIYYCRGINEGRRIEPPPSIYTPPKELASVYPSIGGRMVLFYSKQE